MLFVHIHYFVARPQTQIQLGEPTYEIQEDATHHTLPDVDHGPASREPLHIKAYSSMSDECVEEWIAHHQWGPACTGTDLSEGLKVDGVWAWVNGSDPLQVAARQQYKPQKAMKMDAAHRYVEHNELLYSMRSALTSLGTDTMQRLHILASAYRHPNRTEDVMTGQIPTWIEKEKALSGKSSIVVHHDADYFKPMQSSGINLTSLETQDWREDVLPTFNSLAVEAQIQNIDRVASDQLVYYNDDFFTLRKLAVSDFTTPLYGPVIKTLTRFTSMYLPAEKTFWRTINPAGEEPGIKRAAWVLGKRFALRPYYYITHHPRTLWLPLLREAAQTFPEAFNDTPLSRFRAQDDVPASVQAVFLGSWYVVERHREALLWTWAVAKWGGRSGNLSTESKGRMWNDLAGNVSSSSSSLTVRMPVRAPILNASVFQKANISIPTSTEYSFSSKDGYALAYVDWTWPWNRARHGYPDLTKGLLGNDTSVSDPFDKSLPIRDPSFSAAEACVINRSTCFGASSKDESASEFFKRIAFETPKCGDCIITALIGASGVSGIDKFLPEHTAGTDSEVHTDTITSPPHLPLTSDWTTTDFSITNAIPKGSLTPDMTLRTWCIRLVQRYSYVLGSVESDLYKVERASDLEVKMNEVEVKVQKDEEIYQEGLSMSNTGDWRSRMGWAEGPLTFLCLNDDIKDTGKLRDRIDELLVSFFNKMWPDRMSFEREP
ncbi:hypothetical protein E4T44_00912 [Aureobasidium sp. EXF-8845]|nr:hypothetical protein E4T44_00912 [Aureobasidium sp. EXF-8845]KAI4857621.1 hypothetical protein E4T45_00884 [Aureobasidium sp. EXF-8846]